ncbi:transposable element Tcb2 transposase [Trichonephila clavipes]|nr:transposable element Tcb2 transposase [Trichonephila clavipes]
MEYRISRQIWKWYMQLVTKSGNDIMNYSPNLEIPIFEDIDLDNGIKLLYCHRYLTSVQNISNSSDLLRVEWCCTRGNLTAAKWNQVVFSDESRFNLSSDDNRVRVWRPRGKRFNPAFVLQQYTAPTASVMVWGVIAYNTRLPLVLIRGPMTAQRYVHDFLQPHVLPLMQRLLGAIFQQDNARPHMARVSQDCLCTVTTLPWPARSPDLSRIEYIWDDLGWRVENPTSLNELEAKLQQI